MKVEPRSQLRPNGLESVFDILECLRDGLPVVELAYELHRLVVQLSLDEILFQQAAHDPRQMVRIRLLARGRAARHPLDVELDLTWHIGCFERVGYSQAVARQVLSAGYDY